MWAGRDTAVDTEGGTGARIVTVGAMQRSEVTAVAHEVVAEVLSDPSRFIDAAAEAAPGWSTRYGGPEGVAQLTSVLHGHLAQQTKLNAELRTSTVIYLRHHPRLSLGTIAQLLGVTKAAVQHIVRRSDRGPGMFARLEDPEGWRDNQ